jgi:large subunit ribosomal protein L4
MTIDVYSMTGQKGKSMELPESLFGADVNWGLMHQAVMLQQGNRRSSGAHAKTRGEVQGSTKKLFAQKHTGQARRGAVRSPLLRGGGKTFGPRNVANYERSMPKKMRHAALRSSLSLQAQKGNVIVLEGFADEIKTKTFAALLKKLPIEAGRKVLVVSPGKMKSLQLSARNVPSVTTVYASYLNPESVLNSRYLVFLVDSIKEAEAIFGKKDMLSQKVKPLAKKEVKEKAEKAPKAPKKVATKKPAAKKSASSKK